MRLRARWRAWRMRRRPLSLGLSAASREAQAAAAARLRSDAVAARVRAILQRPSGPGGQRPAEVERGAVWGYLYGRGP